MTAFLGLGLAPGAASPDGAGAGDGAEQDRSLWRHPGSGIQEGQQTSDGVPGAIARPLPAGAARARVVRAQSYSSVPGLNYRTWDQTDARGQVRAHLLTLSYTDRRLEVDYGWTGVVRERAKTRRLVTRADGVAGVNGDFFDIADTGAPLGVGVGSMGLVNTRTAGWNTAFSIDVDGVPRIGSSVLRGSLTHFPDIKISNFNSPTVPMDGIGVYSARWGETAGYRVTDDTTTGVREVVIRRGKVISNSTRLSVDRVIGPRARVLIGRGKGAAKLRQLKVGTRTFVRNRHFLANRSVVITGDQRLLKRGRVVPTNDVEMHPRTAIGIDRDKKLLLFLVVDGRQSFSRGLTLVELAKMMRTLGAEEALNLDGGGSSTMIGPGREGGIRVLNSPSDGQQRYVPNGLVIKRTGARSRG